jgi:transposase
MIRSPSEEGGERGLVTMYVWHKIKVLKANGASIKKIAKELKLSRNTVRKYLRSPDPPEFKKREYSVIFQNKLTAILQNKPAS